MILEEETFEKFGYYPSNLKTKSGKKILVTCDKCGRIRETTKNTYYPLCKSCGHKGKIFSEEHRRRLGDSKRGEKHPFFGKKRPEHARWMREHAPMKNPAVAKKVSASRKGKHYPKISEALSGDKHWNYGKHVPKRVREKISEGMKGKKNHFYGKKHSDATKEKISRANRDPSEETREKMRESKKGKKFSVEHRRRLKEARRRRKFPTSYTKPERIYEDICKKYSIPFKYTGDGSFWIENINPDFVDCNGKKIAVEVFSYWHNPFLRRNIRYTQTYEGRKAILQRYGWKLIVFWEEDLERPDAEAFVLNTLKKEGIL